MLPTHQPSSGSLIPITIETLAGTSFQLLVSPHEQIQSIKRKIERRECIPSTQQHLIFKSNELEDERCLNDYSIAAGTTLKLVLAMRGGPVNTKRVPIEDSSIREMAEYLESSRDDGELVPSSSSSSSKNVTFLVLRDGDQYNFFQVIDRGDGTLSPLSGSVSATSLYNAHETLTVEPEPEFDEKRLDDDRKMKQKMEAIRSKLKTHTRKDVLLPPRPPSSSKPTKSSMIHHHRRHIPLEATSTTITQHVSGGGASSVFKQGQGRSLPYSFSTTLFNPYNLLSAAAIGRPDLLQEEDTDDDDDSADDDDDDEDDDEQKLPSQSIFAARSFSPSFYYQRKHHHHHHHHHHHPSKKLFTQETATASTGDAGSSSSSGGGRVLVDYFHHASPAIPITSKPSRILSAPKCLNATDEPTSADEKNDPSNDILYHHSHASPMLDLIDDETISSTNATRKPTADLHSRNETSLSRPIWTDDDEQINASDEYVPGERTSTSQSMVCCHQASSTDVTSVAPLPQLTKKSTLPSTTQQFYHYHKTPMLEQPPSLSKPAGRPSIPLALAKYRRISSNVHLTSSSPTQPLLGATSTDLCEPSTNGQAAGASGATTTADSFNEHLLMNKRIELLKTPNKQPSPVPLPSSSSKTVFPPPPPPPPPSKRHFAPSEIKSTATTTTTATAMPIDSAKVTIETIGPKTVSALLRQNATIEPVDTSRGMGRHLVSLLTTASKDGGTTSTKTGYQRSSRDAIIEERFKLDSKPSHSLPTNTTTTASSCNVTKLPPVLLNRKSTSKCFLCKKKTGLATTYQCRCGSSFCSEHRYPEAHACAFDYKAEGKRLIERNNPLVTAPKLPKI